MDPLRIAFVSSTRNAKLFRQDPSFIYRCENLGFALKAAGHKVSFIHWTALRPVQVYDVVLFHRPRFSLCWRALLSWLRLGGVRLIADVDDLIFDDALAKWSPGVLNGFVAWRQTRKQYESHYRALKNFDLITTSTEPLAEHLQRCLPKARIKVLPNTVHMSWRDISASGLKSGPGFVLTYLCGTRSHDRDFAVYAKGLERFLMSHTDARLEITGPLRFELTARPGQIVHRGKVPFSNYPELIRRSWVNLAPLEDTPFTRCKSALKVLEAGFWGVPTVCTPILDAERFASASAIFADDHQSCFNSLIKLMDPSYYDSITRGLSESVQAQADITQIAEKFLAFAGSA